MSNAERAAIGTQSIDLPTIQKRAGDITVPAHMPTPLEDAAFTGALQRSLDAKIAERNALHEMRIARGLAFAEAYMNRNESPYPDTGDSSRPSLFDRARVKVGAVAAAALLSTAAGAVPAAASEQAAVSQNQTDLGALPFGYLDSAQREADGFLHLRGWTVDPSGPHPDLGLRSNAVDVWEVDTNTYLGGQHSWDPRPDVDDAFPGVGDYHGFHTAVRPNPGAHQVCVYNLNTDENGEKVEAGGHQLLGCTYVWDEPNQLGLLLLNQRFADQDLSKVHGVIDCEASSSVHAVNGQYTSYFQVDMELHRDLFDSPAEGITMEQVRQGVQNFDGSPYAIDMLKRYLDASYSLWTGTNRQQTWPSCAPQVGA